MNFLDRAIEYIAPGRAIDRTAARVALDGIRNYDGAMLGRRTAGWRATGASANETIKGPLPRLRNRSREVSRNTWWGARVKSVTVAHAVSTGIMPKPMTGNKSLNRHALKAFKTWARQCDREGQLNFDALIALAAGCIVESGEVINRIVPVRQRGPNHVPIELQLLEPDHLDGSKDRPFSQASASIIDQGIEYNIEGKRNAYWLCRSHPGASGSGAVGSIRVDARDVQHVYRKDRIGQGRGVPWVAPVLLKGRDTADLEEAVIVKSRIEACLAAFIKTTNSTRSLGGAAGIETGADGSKRRIDKLSPGAIIYGEPGEEASAIQPSASVQFESVLMCNWLALAAGAGITYDQLTGDLRQANFSSLRAGKIEFRRVIEQFQWLTLVPMLLDPIWERWVEVAQDAGVLPRRAPGFYAVEWIMPANEPIDPIKDMQADMLAVRTGRMTWSQYCGAWGIDGDAQLDEVATWLKDLDRLGVSLDIDPRRPAISPKSIGKGLAADKPKNSSGESNVAK